MAISPGQLFAIIVAAIVAWIVGASLHGVGMDGGGWRRMMAER
jgi:hypothetical protein